MNDRAIGLLDQYDIEVFHTKKGRGSIICETDKGCLILKDYVGNENHINLQDHLLRQLKLHGFDSAEEILATKEGALVTKDYDGSRYVLKTYPEGRECNIYDRTECLEAVRLLAKLHRKLEEIDPEGIPGCVPTRNMEFEKRNRELKKVKRFLRQKSQKNGFEIRLLHTYDLFWEQALKVAKDWEDYRKELPDERTESGFLVCGFCHGDYQYHNIIKKEDGWFLVNFEKCAADDPMRDLYLYLRKLLEKGNWSVNLGKEIVAAYETERPLSPGSRIDLYYRLAYPEKFWKIVNFYYNSSKAWIPERNLEKLTKLLQQEQDKQQFLINCGLR